MNKIRPIYFIIALLSVFNLSSFANSEDNSFLKDGKLKDIIIREVANLNLSTSVDIFNYDKIKGVGLGLKYNYENDLKDLFKYLDQDLNSLNNKSKFFLYYLRGKYLQKKDTINYAIDSYKKSIDLNNNYLETYIDLLSLLEQINNLEEFKIYLDVANINFIHDHRIKFLESLYYNRVKEIEQSQKIISRYTLQEKLKNNQNFYHECSLQSRENYEKLFTEEVFLKHMTKVFS